ncbi:hypothetical protein [Modestobacter marinus]|uniref:hypothetical protein n=1 Tax=Modestobacter marinus TaxID=477641 RepID=UPI001C9668C3|nr:hypothetical protein [Modestobacter marinus]
MIFLAGALVFVAVGLLAGGLAQGSATLQWGSFAASALAAVLLGLSELRRRRKARTDQPARPARRPEVPPAAEEPAFPPAQTAFPPSTVRPATGGSSSLGRLAQPADDEVVRRVAPPPVPPSSPALRRVTGPQSVAPAGLPEPEVPPGVGAEPPAEEVEFTDLLLIMDLTDEVLVVDEHPRYHLSRCPAVAGVPTIPIPLDQARADGFTPCGICTPDRNLAERERARRN